MLPLDLFLHKIGLFLSVLEENGIRIFVSLPMFFFFGRDTSGTLPLHAYSSQGEQPLLGGDWDLSLLHCVRKHVFFLLSGSQKPHRARAVYGTEAVGVAVARRKTSAMDLESRQPLKGSERE